MSNEWSHDRDGMIPGCVDAYVREHDIPMVPKAQYDALAARVAELEQGMREIRFSGHNEPAIAIWMQKVAAHAMEPKQFPHPGSFPGADSEKP